ncbi:glycosyltransferase family 2 protein [Bdellovibrionota bacterium FG-2]
MKVSIVIPVYNEANTVQTLLNRVWLQELPRGLEKELIIIESNSTDKSREIVQNFAKTHEQTGTVKLILQEVGKGKGNAMKEGFAAATGDIILIQDADLEYDVADYPALLDPILDGHANFVLGSRHLSAGSWKIRKFEGNPFKAALLNFGGVFFHALFNLLYNQSLTDPTTMYKVFRRSCIGNTKFVSDRFDFDFELVAKLIRKGNSPLEVPVSYTSRGFEEGKKVPCLSGCHLIAFKLRCVAEGFSDANCGSKATATEKLPS